MAVARTQSKAKNRVKPAPAVVEVSGPPKAGLLFIGRFVRFNAATVVIADRGCCLPVTGSHPMDADVTSMSPDEPEGKEAPPTAACPGHIPDEGLTLSRR